MFRYGFRTEGRNFVAVKSWKEITWYPTPPIHSSFRCHDKCFQIPVVKFLRRSCMTTTNHKAIASQITTRIILAAVVHLLASRASFIIRSSCWARLLHFRMLYRANIIRQQAVQISLCTRIKGNGIFIQIFTMTLIIFQNLEIRKVHRRATHLF